MKVLIVSHACALPQNQSMFAIAAKRRGWHVTMVIPQGWKNEYGDRMPASLADGFDADLLTLPVIRNGSVPLHAYRAPLRKYGGRIANILRQHDPDVVYSHNEGYALSTIQWSHANARSINRPFGFFSCQNILKRYPTPFRQAERRVHRSSSFFFPITRSVEAVHRTKGYTGASTILPLGFDSSVYRSTQRIEDRHQRQTGPVRFAFVGRVVEEKGLITLAKALGMIRDHSWHLTMVGSGPYESQVKKAMQNAGIADRIDWRGFMPHAEVARFYESVDCLLLPSESRSNWTEQFGRVMVESMACGTPVVGSDSGEIPNIIRTSGGGLVFREADANDLSENLLGMINNPLARAEMAVVGHKYVHDQYSIDCLANRFADAIEMAAWQ